MKTLLIPQRIVIIVALTVVWCGLWGQFSVANVLAGALIAGGIVASGAGPTGQGAVRPFALLRLARLIMTDLVKSTISVAVEIATPGDGTEEAIIAVEVPPESTDHFLLLAAAITLTPGTAVVDVDYQTSTIYLHLLDDSGRAETIDHVAELARLASEALPSRPERTRA